MFPTAKQTAETDKLLKPPRGGGKSNKNSDFRSAERCPRSLSRQIIAIQMKFPEEDMVLIGKSDRLLVLQTESQAENVVVVIWDCLIGGTGGRGIGGAVVAKSIIGDEGKPFGERVGRSEAVFPTLVLPRGCGRARWGGGENGRAVVGEAISGLRGKRELRRRIAGDLQCILAAFGGLPQRAAAEIPG